MRAEKKKKSETWSKIQSYVDGGKLVPTELVIEVLGKAINMKEKGKSYLIDGMPREIEQALLFEQMIAEIDNILQFECSEEEILRRLIGRMESTPIDKRRSDDKPEIIKQRVATYFKVSKPATDFYKKLGRVREVSAIGSPDEVFERTCKALQPNVI